MSITFKKKEIFGNKFIPSIKSSLQYTILLLTREIIIVGSSIAKAGTLDFNKGVNLSKTELWSYIYYLYYYNKNTNRVFNSMKKGKANAFLFLESILNYVKASKIDKITLVTFINKIINDYKLLNPLIDNLVNIMNNKEVIPRLSEILIKNGNVTNNVNSADIKIYVSRAIK